MPSQIARIVIDIDLAGVFHFFEANFSRFYLTHDSLADMLHRRQILIVFFQCIIGMRVGSDNVLDAGVQNGIRILIL